ncbi:hypothetical protein P3L10_027880 [Capsicum annuum]
MPVSHQWIPNKCFLLLQRVFLPSECLHSHVVGQHAKELLEDSTLTATKFSRMESSCFSLAQWQELQLQALIYKHMLSVKIQG